MHKNLFEKENTVNKQYNYIKGKELEENKNITINDLYSLKNLKLLINQ